MSNLRGHKIYEKQGVFYYEDNNQSTVGNVRSCGHCGLNDTKEGHDGCLGELDGVMNACCGHGSNDEAYIMFEDKTIIRGRLAMIEFALLSVGMDRTNNDKQNS